MNLETVDISDISQDPANVRKHSERNLEAIAASSRAFGQQKPIVVDKRGVILAGNGTYEAAKRIGWDKIQITRTDLSGTLATAYAIADNRTAELAEWDDTALAEQLRSLQSEEFDLSNVGYTDDEVQQLIDGIGNEILGASEVTEDEIPEPPVEPITKPGDLWLLGEHRLLCGDSTNADDVKRLMNGEKADLCFTSPPYAQQRNYTDESQEKLKDWDSLIEGVFSNLQMADDGQVLVNLGLIHKDKNVVCYWDGLISIMKTLGFNHFAWYVWEKGFSARYENGRLSISHEWIFHFNKTPKDPDKFIECVSAGRVSVMPVTYSNKNGQHRDKSKTKETNSHRIAESVIRISRSESNQPEHPAAFPVKLPSVFIQSWPGLTYEPFCGSGTTLIAAEQLGRKCYGMEISPQYCDVIVKRWETLTGMVATRA